MTDSDTTVETLKETVRDFAQKRDWRQFHTPKNLALSVVIEAAELLEHFQWLEARQTERDRLSPEKKEEIGAECADVLAYLLGLADRLEIDLAEAFERKMERNRRKYPEERFRGRYGYDDPKLEKK